MCTEKKPASPAGEAKSPDAREPLGAQINGNDIEKLFLTWSEWTTELGEAISRKNIDGFVSDLRALLREAGSGK
ncbi:hypothetical protein [Paraburkholderia dilworthii]|uniref:hypothetical protein n=1 Tax=Paraburkholderia dilworthii TaxID=948106 RepID=UPI0004082AC3|nr:hypothetical protein [Paraburkholderia dilworthii]